METIDQFANSIDTAPAKYSKEYFEERIQVLQKEIGENLPVAQDSEFVKNYLNACRAAQESCAALKQARSLLDTLTKEKASDNAIQKAKDLVGACQRTVELVESDVAASGQPVLSKLNLQKSMKEATLLECTVLVQSTPQGLADWIELNPDLHANLLSKFLSNIDWMKQMILSGGASKGNYGPAIFIHTSLLYLMDQDPTPSTAVRRKLALATALEHATPIAIFKREDIFINPVRRFWHYVHAFENGELDKHFEHFSVWELRLIVDCNAMCEELQWGRDYLKAYRPDQISMPSDQWRYLMSVRTDINYHQPEHEFSNYTDVLSAGGECGARAWFGRFICKAWGNPTWGVREPGHAALSRWTPEKWMMCMGAPFEYAYWDDDRYTGKNKSHERQGPDFVEETEARKKTSPGHYYAKLTLLECLAESLGETVEEQVHADKLWRSLSLSQRRVFAQQNSETLQIPSPTKPPEMVDEEIGVLSSGSIIIPASSFVVPSKPTKDVLVMPSNLGGNQVHLEHTGSVSYILSGSISPGLYTLTCRYVTVHRRQVPLALSIETEACAEVVDTYNIEIAYSKGLWFTSIPIYIDLSLGVHLKFERSAGCHGLSIKDFTLEPKRRVV